MGRPFSSPRTGGGGAAEGGSQLRASHTKLRRNCVARGVLLSFVDLEGCAGGGVGSILFASATASTARRAVLCSSVLRRSFSLFLPSLSSLPLFAPPAPAPLCAPATQLAPVANLFALFSLVSLCELEVVDRLRQAFLSSSECVALVADDMFY
uniref:Uncharacterized protein n=1 Tax=Plectus sambesii TaxID=2011161 RepID=A0A914WTJ4_9BILA